MCLSLVMIPWFSGIIRVELTHDTDFSILQTLVNKIAVNILVLRWHTHTMCPEESLCSEERSLQHVCCLHYQHIFQPPQVLDPQALVKLRHNQTNRFIIQKNILHPKSAPAQITALYPNCTSEQATRNEMKPATSGYSKGCSPPFGQVQRTRPQCPLRWGLLRRPSETPDSVPTPYDAASLHSHMVSPYCHFQQTGLHHALPETAWTIHIIQKRKLVMTSSWQQVYNEVCHAETLKSLLI